MIIASGQVLMMGNCASQREHSTPSMNFEVLRMGRVGKRELDDTKNIVSYFFT